MLDPGTDNIKDFLENSIASCWETLRRENQQLPRRSEGRLEKRGDWIRSFTSVLPSFLPATYGSASEFSL